MQNELNAIDTVARAVDRISRRGRFAEFTLQNGIVLSVRPIPPLLLTAVNDEFHIPDPPVVWLEDKGRNEPNPNDPNYLKEIQRLADAQDLAVENLTIAVGTDVKFVPEGFFKPEDEGWVEKIEFANKLVGIDIKIEAEDKIKRYLQWLRFYAMESAMDISMVRNLPTMLAGIREGEVDEVLDSFRRLPERGTDNVGDDQTGDQNGNRGNRRQRRARS